MTIIKFVNKMNNAKKTRETTQIVNFYATKQIKNLLDFLEEREYLNYKLISCNQNYYELKITGSRFEKLKVISKPSMQFVVSYAQLRHSSEHIILSTSMGLLLREEAIEYKIGGVIAFKII